MQTYGRVIKILDGKALVVVSRTSACSGNCGSCGGCGEASVEALAENPVGAVPGDFVALSSDTKSVLSLAFMTYILPLAAFIAVYLILEKFSARLAALCAIIAFAVLFAIPKIKAKSNKITVTEIIRGNEN